jgi:hypothetical protein
VIWLLIAAAFLATWYGWTAALVGNWLADIGRVDSVDAGVLLMGAAIIAIAFPITGTALLLYVSCRALMKVYGTGIADELEKRFGGAS